MTTPCTQPPVLEVSCTFQDSLHPSLAISLKRERDCGSGLPTRFVSRIHPSHTHSTSENTQTPRQCLESNFPTLASARGCLVAVVPAFSPLRLPRCLPNKPWACLWLPRRDGAPRQSRPPEIGWDVSPPRWTPLHTGTEIPDKPAKL